MTHELKQVASIRCNPIVKGKYSQYFSKEDVEIIKNYNLDFILRFGFGIVRGEILDVARYGVWSFHHDDENKYRGAPPCFWEMYYGDPVTGAILQRLTDRLDGGIVLKKGFFKTHSTTYVKNRDTIYFISSSWPAQVCIDIQNGVADYINGKPSISSAPVFVNPNNFQVLYFFVKILFRYIRRWIRGNFYYDLWGIGIMKALPSGFLKTEKRPRISWVPVPDLAQSNFIADPFGVYYKGKLNILCEEYNHLTRTGKISAIVDNDEFYSFSSTVIKSKYHMSYPYLIKYRNDIYCIPETCDANEISLYKAKDFPETWEKVFTLIENFRGIDSTVVKYNGYWWLFSTDNSIDKLGSLTVWYAKDLFGPWEPHANNPVKLDVRSSRPAGTPFVHNGHLYRPSQDCSGVYGGRIVLNRIKQLSPIVFEEEKVAVIEPDKKSSYPDGIHTICCLDDIIIVDGFKHKLIFGNFSLLARKIKNPFVKILRRIKSL